MGSGATFMAEPGMQLISHIRAEAAKLAIVLRHESGVDQACDSSGERFLTGLGDKRCPFVVRGSEPYVDAETDCVADLGDFLRLGDGMQHDEQSPLIASIR